MQHNVCNLPRSPEGTMSAVYLLLLLVPAISAQTFHWGSCPTPKVQANFSLTQVSTNGTIYYMHTR